MRGTGHRYRMGGNRLKETLPGGQRPTREDPGGERSVGRLPRRQSGRDAPRPAAQLPDGSPTVPLGSRSCSPSFTLRLSHGRRRVRGSRRSSKAATHSSTCFPAQWASRFLRSPYFIPHYRAAQDLPSRSPDGTVHTRLAWHRGFAARRSAHYARPGLRHREPITCGSSAASLSRASLRSALGQHTCVPVLAARSAEARQLGNRTP